MSRLDPELAAFIMLIVAVTVFLTVLGFMALPWLVWFVHQVMYKLF